MRSHLSPPLSRPARFPSPFIPKPNHQTPHKSQKQQTSAGLDWAAENIRKEIRSSAYRSKVEGTYSTLKKQVKGTMADLVVTGTEQEWMRAPPGYLEERVVLFELGGLHAGKVFSGAQLGITVRLYSADPSIPPPTPAPLPNHSSPRFMPPTHASTQHPTHASTHLIPTPINPYPDPPPGRLLWVERDPTHEPHFHPGCHGVDPTHLRHPDEAAGGGPLLLCAVMLRSVVEK